MTIDIPPGAKKALSEAVNMLQENLTQRHPSYTTGQVIDKLKSAVGEYPKYFDAWRLLGEVYLGTEQTLKGYLALKRAHYINSEDVAASTLLGEASLILGRPALALKYLKQAKSGEEVPLAVRKLKALALAKAEEWEDALRAFGEALGEDPSDGDMRRECADVLSELGFNKEAVSVLADYLDPFRDFIDNQPAVAETEWVMHYGAVLDRLEAGARKKAAGKEVVAHPEDYRAWCAVGNLFLDGEQWAAAVACYRRALRVHPDYYDALHNMGIALEELGRPEEAMQMYETAMEADPDSPEAYLSIAELLADISPEDVDEIALNYLTYYRMYYLQAPPPPPPPVLLDDPEAEGFKELESELMDRLESTPDVAQMLLLSHIYLLRDETDKAEAMVRRIELVGGGEASLQLLKGQVLHELGQLDEAEEAYRRGLENTRAGDRGEGDGEAEDVEPQLRFGLAELLVDADKKDKAVKILTEQPDSLNPDGLAFLAELLLEIKPGEAEDTWRKALDIDPEHVPSLVGLAERYIDLKKYEDAIILLEKALEVDPEDEETAARLCELYPEIGAPELSPEIEEMSELGDNGEIHLEEEDGENDEEDEDDEEDKEGDERL